MKRVKMLEAGLSDKERKITYTSPKSGKQIQVPVHTEGMKVTEIMTVKAGQNLESRGMADQDT